MSWASSSPNEAITFNEMFQSGIPLNINQSHDYTNNCITKLELRTKYGVKEVNLERYLDDELVMKKDIIQKNATVVSYSYLVGLQSNGSSAACGHTSGTMITVYSSDNYPDGKLRTGMILYDDSTLIHRFLGAGMSWYTISPEIAIISRNGEVLSMYECNANFLQVFDYYQDPCSSDGIWKNLSNGKYYNAPNINSGYANGIYFTYGDQQGIDHELTGLYAWNRYFFDGTGNDPVFTDVIMSPCSQN